MKIFKGGFCKINHETFDTVFTELLEEEHMRATDELMKHALKNMAADLDQKMKEIDDYFKSIDGVFKNFDNEIQNMFKNGK